MVYTKKNLIASDDNMYLTVDSLIEVNNIITGSNNFTLRKVNVKPYGLEKMCMDKDLIEDKLYQIIDQFSERKITPVKFYLMFLNHIHPFYDGNGKTCKRLFPNDDKISILNKEELSDLLRVQTTYKIIFHYCLKYIKSTESKNPKFAKTIKGKLIISYLN